MLGTLLNSRVRRTLGVSIDDGLALTLVDTPTVYFPANVGQPQSENGSLDGSPRTSRATSTLTCGPATSFLGACDRIEVPGDTTYELLAEPRKLLNGRRVVGFSAPMLPVSVLYPRSADLTPMGGGEVITTVECSVYSTRDTDTSRGSYEETFCEMPPAAWEHIDGESNLELRFADGSVWKLAEATLGTEVPFVTATIKKAG